MGLRGDRTVHREREKVRAKQGQEEDVMTAARKVMSLMILLEQGADGFAYFSLYDTTEHVYTPFAFVMYLCINMPASHGVQSALPNDALLYQWCTRASKSLPRRAIDVKPIFPMAKTVPTALSPRRTHTYDTPGML